MLISFHLSTKGDNLHQHIASLLRKLEITSAFKIPGAHYAVERDFEAFKGIV